MGSAVTALNRYTKTIIEFKYKRRNIEKSLMIKQKMMELDLPEQMWDMYLTAVPADGEAQLELPANGHKPSTGTTYVVEMDNVPEPQGEAYCWKWSLSPCPHGPVEQFSDWFPGPDWLVFLDLNF